MEGRPAEVTRDGVGDGSHCAIISGGEVVNERLCQDDCSSCRVWIGGGEGGADVDNCSGKVRRGHYRKVGEVEVVGGDLVQGRMGIRKGGAVMCRCSSREGVKPIMTDWKSISPILPYRNKIKSIYLPMNT